jgi:hypothetical protein
MYTARKMFISSDSVPQFYLFFFCWGRTKYTSTVAIHSPVVAALDDDSDCGAVGGMNETFTSDTLATTDPSPDFTRARTRASAVRSRRLTA